MAEYPPYSCPHCGHGVTVRVVLMVKGEPVSWRTGFGITPNYVNDEGSEYYDKAWCSGCQTQFFVEGR